MDRRIEPGDIVHVDGRFMGRHDGVINFTVGQRRGLGVATGEPRRTCRAGRRLVRCGEREVRVPAVVVTSAGAILELGGDQEKDITAGRLHLRPWQPGDEGVLTAAAMR